MVKAMGFEKLTQGSPTLLRNPLREIFGESSDPSHPSNYYALCTPIREYEYDFFCCDCFAKEYPKEFRDARKRYFW